MNKIILLFIFLSFPNHVFSQITFQKKHQRTEFSFKIEVAKRTSQKYFDNDTATYTAEELYPMKYSKNKYPCGNFAFKRYLDHQLIISAEFRYKLWGFEEYFPIKASNPSPSIEHGFAITLFNIDVGVNLHKRIQLVRRLEFRPRVGLSLFCPGNAGYHDTLYYEPSGIADFNYTYEGSKVKMGLNGGAELCWSPGQRFNINLGCIYYRPFNNTYNWHLRYKVVDVDSPLRKWRKKNDGLYFGLGIDYLLNKKRISQ